MLYWFADDSEYNSQASSNPDVFVYGGIILAHSDLIDFRRTIEQTKSQYFDSRLPIKWNIRDLEKSYKKHNVAEQYNLLLANSQEIRRNIIQSVAGFNYKIVVGAIESVFDEGKILKEKKAELASYSFVMGLQRFALEAKDLKMSAQVVLDWPDKNDSAVLRTEYAHAYNYGTSKRGNEKYISGCLKELNFNDSLFFTTMLNSTALQFADLIVGATKDYLQSLTKEKKKTIFIDEVFDMLAPKFRGYPDFIGKGLIISTNSPKLLDLVRKDKK